jgi:hypothetical protein
VETTQVKREKERKRGKKKKEEKEEEINSDFFLLYLPRFDLAHAPSSLKVSILNFMIIVNIHRFSYTVLQLQRKAFLSLTLTAIIHSSLFLTDLLQ